MNKRQPDFWVRMLVGLACATFVTVMVHAVDDLMHGNTAGFSVEAFVLTVILVSTLDVFGIAWSWQGKVYGYLIVGLYAFRYAVGFVIAHVFVFDIPNQRGYAEIAQATPAVWAPVFVGSALLGGVFTLSTTVVAASLTARSWRESRQVNAQPIVPGGRR
jgi:hypothetical protein